jgi:hypothetical protein
MKYFILFFAIWLGACTGKKTGDDAIIPIPLDPGQAESVSWDSLFDASSIQVIPLETTKDALLGHVFRLRVMDSTYAILSNSSIYLFNHAGELSLKISKEGRGPGEYRALEDFYLDHHAAWLLDCVGQKVIEYSLEGEFIREINTRLYGLAFVNHNDSSWCIYTGASVSPGSKYRINYFSRTSEEIMAKEHLITDREAEWRHFVDPENFFTLGDETYLFYFLNDTIYTLGANKAIPRYVFDGGKYKFPDRLLEKGFEDIMAFVQATQEKSYIVHIMPLIAKEGVYLAFNLHGEMLHAYYSTRTGGTQMIKRYDNFLGVPGFSLDARKALMPKLYDNGCYYYLIDPVFFPDEHKASFVQKYHLPDLDENDNPIVIKVKMKREK